MPSRLLIVIFCVCCIVGVAAAQTEPGEQRLNPVDQEGRAHGLWKIRSAGSPGEPAFQWIGHYEHGMKEGEWYKMDLQGELLAIEHFFHNQLDGDVKYYEHGKLYCTGQYKAYKSEPTVDSIVVVDPGTHEQSWVAIQNIYGSHRHGMWYYMDTESGHIIREEEYILDELIYRKDVPSKRYDSLLLNTHYPVFKPVKKR